MHQCIQVVQIIARLELDKTIAFADGHSLKYLLCENTADLLTISIFRYGLQGHGGFPENTPSLYPSSSTGEGGVVGVLFIFRCAMPGHGG